jgi:hypothetical protein
MLEPHIAPPACVTEDAFAALMARLDRADDCCGTMAQTIDCPALDEIEIFLSLLIGQPGAAPFDEHDGRTPTDLRPSNF